MCRQGTEGTRRKAAATPSHGSHDMGQRAPEPRQETIRLCLSPELRGQFLVQVPPMTDGHESDPGALRSMACTIRKRRTRYVHNPANSRISCSPPSGAVVMARMADFTERFRSGWRDRMTSATCGGMSGQKRLTRGLLPWSDRMPGSWPLRNGAEAFLVQAMYDCRPCDSIF
jgi:hypothetical protein